jgi:hypothetical protein
MRQALTMKTPNQFPKPFDHLMIFAGSGLQTLG